MSRIEEALRRARTTGVGAPTAPVAEPAAEDLPTEDAAADSPWRFDQATSAGRPAPASPSSHASQSAHAAQRAHAAQGSRSNAVSGSPASPAPRGAVLPDSRHGDAVHGFTAFDRTIEERVIVSKDIPAVSVEQYRRLAATLHHAQADRGVARVMISSAVAGEGKSLTATNLALTLSQSYRRRVLLIDADLRRPSLHRIFQVQNVSGLNDGLKAHEERKLSIVEVSEHLSLLTAGRPDPDPMSGLTSERMRRILDEAGAKFDWVVIDTPPVALLPDANLLAAMVDVAILVIGATRTSYDLVQRALDSIGRDKVMGVVLNRADSNALAGDPHYQSYFEAYARPR